MEELNEISLRERIRLNLVFAMEKANINQVNLADKLGISKGTVNNWVRGNNSPDVDMVPKICKVLNISILELYSPTRYESIDNSQKAPSYSDEAMKLAEDYDGLDKHGKRVVRLVADEEKSRCEADRQAKSSSSAPLKIQKQREQMEAAELLEPEKVIRFRVPEYTMPMSAGTGEEAMQEFPQDRELSKAPPRGTSYIAHVSGDSMEPTYHNEDMVFVHACEEIPVGRIGVFLMNGKQWIKELGDGVLISHNPEYDPILMRDDIKCQGLVLGVCDDSYFE